MQIFVHLLHYLIKIFIIKKTFQGVNQCEKYLPCGLVHYQAGSFSLLFFLIQQFWEMVVSEFALFSLAFIQILLMILSTFLISKFVKTLVAASAFGSYLFIIGSLFSFWLANNPLELQAVILYMIGAFWRHSLGIFGPAQQIFWPKNMNLANRGFFFSDRKGKHSSYIV